MKQRIFILTFIISTVSLHASACFNGEILSLSNGQVISVDEQGTIIPRGHNYNYLRPARLKEEFKEFTRLWQTTRNLDYLSDCGLMLVIFGKYTAAKELYLLIERMQAGRYSTAANLGTIYELLGENKNALIWIEKAVKINPKSHSGSEWIHVNILKAKINGPDYITSDFLINTNFGKWAKPYSTLDGKKLLDLRNAIFFQLNERMSFIKPKDPVIAQLLFDQANLAVLTRAEEAKTLYRNALEYGFSAPIWNLRYSYSKMIDYNDN